MPRFKRSVAGIAVERGRLFVARRKAGGDLGGKWEFPGGKVEDGESDEDALRREYREEFGLEVETGPLLASAQFEHNGQSFLLNAYRIFFNSDIYRSDMYRNDMFRLVEHTEWQWAALGVIERLDFAGSDTKLFPALQAYLEQQPAIP
jgi:8-oxo-dGTP diphosphatase